MSEPKASRIDILKAARVELNDGPISRALGEAYREQVARAIAIRAVAGPDRPVPEIRRDNAAAIIEAYQALPPPPADVLDHATYILSEWLNDGTPVGEGRYRAPAEALLRFAALVSSRG